MKTILCVTFWVFLSASLFAHQDTPIKLKKDGTLKGLPKEYSPATYDRNRFTLKIGAKGIVIPDFITAQFDHCKDYQITFYSSWYHETELLPHYIHMDIEIPNDTVIYQIYFNLKTLEIFQILKKELIQNEDNTFHYNTHQQAISKAGIEIIFNAIFGN